MKIALKNVFLSILILLSTSGCTTLTSNIRESDSYCSIESPTLTAWAYNQKGYNHLKNICKNGNGNSCSEKLLNHSMNPYFETETLGELVAEREKQKLICGDSLDNTLRYSINNKLYNKVLSNMRKRAKKEREAQLKIIR